MNTSSLISSPRQKLEEFPLGKTLVEISRKFKVSKNLGYVLEIGPTFFLVANVSDGIRFDGFHCLRIEDVLEVTPYKRAAFAETALAKRGEQLPFKPRIDLGGIQELLLTANQLFPIVAIYREHYRKHCCWIGRVVNVNSTHVSLLEINPDATWDCEPIEHLLHDITRVDFGGDYEEALALVGGHPPNPLTTTPLNTSTPAPTPTPDPHSAFGRE